MVWLANEEFVLLRGDLLDGLERRFKAQRLELFGVVVRQQPIADMVPQVGQGSIVEGADGRLLDGAYHAFGLAVGLWMIGLGQAMIDAALGADPAEDVADEALRGLPVVLDELHAVVGQHRVNLIRNSPDQGLEEACGDELRRLSIDPGEDELRRSIYRNEQIGLPTFVMQFSDVDMEIANLIRLEPLGLLAVCLGQA